MDANYTSHFADIVADNYDNILENFKRGLKNKGYSFDEDVFMDTFISCNTTLNNKKLNKEEAIKYFWTSYVNKLKTLSSQNSNTVYIEDMFVRNENDFGDPWDELNIIDSTYNENIDDLYDLIISLLKEKYGERELNICDLHVCRGVHTKELIDMGYTDIDFEYLTKKMKRYIKNHIVKDNKYIAELLSNIRN